MLLLYLPAIITLLKILGIIVIAFYSTNLIESYVIKKIEKKAKSLNKETIINLVNISKNLVKILIYSITLLIILSILGIDVTPILASLGIASFVLSFSLKDVLSNLVSGLILNIDPPFKIGDFIEYPGSKKILKGFIKEIGLRSTKIETQEGDLIILPNSQVINKDIINYSKNKFLTVYLNFCFKNVELERLEKIIKEELRNLDFIEEVKVLLKEFNSSQLKVSILVKSKIFNEDLINDKVNRVIYRLFKENKVELC